MTSRRPTALGGVVRTMRPQQWLKNVLVLAAPLLSGSVLERDVLLGALVAFVAFSLAASGIYLVNDVRDVEADRAHPRKRHRPVAAGVVEPRTALAVAAVLLVVAPAVAAATTSELVIVVGVYEAVSLAYCLWLKDEPVIDIAIVASGFLLRAVAGGVASEIPLSQWFLLSAAFGSLFMAAGKRYAESRAEGEPADLAATRKSLGRYTQTYLRFVWSMSASVLITTYGLWAFEVEAESDSPLAVISLAPFVLAVLRYAVDVDAGAADEPETIALQDRLLQGLGLVWLALVALAVYA